MGKTFIERRRHRRAIYSLQEGLIGSFIAPGADGGTVLAPILNLSAGGIGFALVRGHENGIRPGDRLVLQELRIQTESCRRSLEINSDLSLVVRWILNAEFLDHVGFGCEFIDPTDQQQNRIRDFLEAVYPDRLG